MSRMNAIALLFAAALVVPAAATDSLVVQPPHPTTADSVRFTVLITLPCNCIQAFYPDSIARVAADSMVQLSFRQGVMACNAMMCVDTLRLPISLSFKCGPLPAGTYGVYEVISAFCDSGMACPNLVLSLRLGTVSVASQTSVLRRTADAVALASRSGHEGQMFTIRGELIDRGVTQSRAAGIVVAVGRNSSLAVVSTGQHR